MFSFCEKTPCLQQHLQNKYLLGAYSFNGLVHYYCGKDHGGTQADMMLVKLLTAPHHEPQVAGRVTDRDLGLGFLNTQTQPL